MSLSLLADGFACSRIPDPAYPLEAVFGDMFGHPRLSVKRDLFGFWVFRRTTMTSLRSHLETLRQHRFNLNFIVVGSEAYEGIQQGSIQQYYMEKLDNVIAILRRVYAGIGIGLGRVERYFLPNALADGAQRIDNSQEAADLTREWGGANDGVDVYLVPSVAGGKVGWGPGTNWLGNQQTGSCQSFYETFLTDSPRWLGVVVLFPVGSGTLAATIATWILHELGHFFGLGHTGNSGNVMFRGALTTQTAFTAAQVERMKEHFCMPADCSEIYVARGGGGL